MPRHDIHPFYIALLRQWCAATGRDVPTWAAIVARRRRIWPRVAAHLRDTMGIPLTAWLGLEPVETLTYQSESRPGRPLTSARTIMGHWLQAHRESYASVGRAIGGKAPIPRTTVQAYDQGKLAAPRAFRVAVQKLTHDWLHAEAWPHSRP